MDDLVERHRRACDGFSRAVAAASGRWTSPSPCTDWDAAGVVEHVIGFHDMLLLRPLGTKPERPRDGSEARWSVTVDAVTATFSDPTHLDAEVEVPGMGTARVASLLTTLTTDVLVHTWDLARAVGADDTLDRELCELAHARALENEQRIRSSSMFGPRVEVADDADVQSRVLGLFGRDPAWEPRTG